MTGPCPGGIGPILSNADPAPTLSERSPLLPGRRPGQLGRTMRGKTSQAGNRARKTRRRSRRGEHAGELGGGSPEASGVWDRHALLFAFRVARPRRGSSPRELSFISSPASSLCHPRDSQVQPRAPHLGEHLSYRGRDDLFYCFWPPAMVPMRVGKSFSNTAVR